MGNATPARETVFKPGDVIEGRYRIVREIGSGGMGTVFLTEHVLIKRRLAVKVLHAEFAADADVIDRFMNEARVVGTLGHPNIVESTDMGFARDMPYIVFEYLEGTPLSDEVYRLNGLPFRRAIKIAHQIASALEAAHAAGIVHRDLKSDNVFLTHRDEVPDHVKVIDFGISRFGEAEQPSGGGGARRPSMVMGTPEFMAPEQITAPDSVDQRTDIYALGVVLYEMLASRTPFINENDNEALLHKIVLEKPPPLNRPELPPGLLEMIMERLLAKEPDKRFQTMKDVKGALEAFWGATRRDSQPIEPITIEEVQAAAAAAAAKAADSTKPKVVEPVALPPPPKASILPMIVLALLAIAGFVAGGVLMNKSSHRVPVVDPAAAAAVGDDANTLGAQIDSAASSMETRAQGLASTPMLRAAIETDAATLQDMIHDGALFKPAAGEVIDIVQERDGKKTSLIRLPQTAKPLGAGNEPRALREGDQVRVTAGAPVNKANGDTVAGDVVVAGPVDFAGTAAKLKDHVLDARLEGLGAPIPLVPGSHDGEPVSRPVPSKLKGTKLTLVATVARVMPPDVYKTPALGSFAVGGLLLVFVVVGLFIRKGRARGKA